MAEMKVTICHSSQALLSTIHTYYTSIPSQLAACHVHTVHSSSSGLEDEAVLTAIRDATASCQL